MQIHQFKLQFQPEEDRVLFLMNTTDHQEFRFYLTRRFVRILWPVVERLLETDYRRRQPVHADQAREILPFEQERMVAQTDFQRQYEETPTSFPLGETPLLLTRIQVKSGTAGDILCLLPSNGPGVEIPGHPRFLHPFQRLLADVVHKAEWNLDVPAASPMMVPPSSGGTVH